MEPFYWTANHFWSILTNKTVTKEALLFTNKRLLLPTDAVVPCQVSFISNLSTVLSCWIVGLSWEPVCVFHYLRADTHVQCLWSRYAPIQKWLFLRYDKNEHYSFIYQQSTYMYCCLILNTFSDWRRFTSNNLLNILGYSSKTEFNIVLDVLGR